MGSYGTFKSLVSHWRTRTVHNQTLGDGPILAFVTRFEPPTLGQMISRDLDEFAMLLRSRLHSSRHD
jgi:hypothetical protein